MNRSAGGESLFELVPDEILLLILSKFTKAADFKRVRLVCSRWRACGEDEMRWRSLYESVFGGPRVVEALPEGAPFSSLSYYNYILASQQYDDTYEPMEWAAERGHYALLEKLIQIGRPSPGGNMLMHLAARYGHVSVIRVLRDESESMPVKETITGFTFGNSPLHTAVQYGQIEVAKFLLSLGADPLVRQPNKLYGGDTPWDLAKWHTDPALEALFEPYIPNLVAKKAAEKEL